MRHQILGLLALGAILSCATAEEEGLRAEYFTNTTLTPPIALDTITPTVSFNWGSAGPAGVGADQFSARWSGQVIPTETGPHTMFMRSDAGARVWLNGTLIINDWSAHSARDASAVVDLIGGTPVDLIIEYYENTGNAVAQLSWATPTLARHPIPSSKLRPTLLVNPFGTGTGLTGFYYAGKNFDRLALTRLDSRVAFTWGSGAPAMEIPADNFSVRWLGSYEAQRTEALTLIARADDGVRVWLDGAAVIDDWVPTSARDRTYTFNAEAGRRYSIRMDYFEAAGSASAVLEFQGPNTPRAAVSTQFYPVEGVQVSLPSASPVSPVFIEGLYAPDVTVTATADGDAVPVEALSDIAFYLDCPLSPTAPIQMTLQAGEFQHAATIAWTPTPVVGVSEATIRAGDALLFQTMADGYRRIDHESGVELPEAATQAGELWPFRFGRAGIYHVLTLDGAGEVTGKVVVTVVGVAMPERVASKVNYARIFETEFRPLSATPVFVANDPTYLTVSQAVPVDGIVAVTSKPLRRGSPQVLARLYANGPIIARTVVDEFSYSVASLRQAVVNAATGIGTSTLVMRPYVEDVEFRLDMFAHKGRFKGGVKSFRINTSASQSTHGEPGFTTKIDEKTGETIGIFRFDLEIPPNESMYCYRIRAWQANEVVAVEDAGENAIILGRAPTAGSNVIANLVSFLWAATSGGDSAASSSENVNGDVCHVQAFHTLIFMKADDPAENEVAESSNPENWLERKWTMVSTEVCPDDDDDDECADVSYKLKIKPPTEGGSPGNDLKASFNGNEESDCKPCNGACDDVSPEANTGTIPTKYETEIIVCSIGDDDAIGTTTGGAFWVSKLDAHGPAGPQDQFPQFVNTLPKRRGTVFDPVIQINKGGVLYEDGEPCLYGVGDNGCSNPCSTKVMNRWSLTAVARDPETGANLPDGYYVRWRLSNGRYPGVDTAVSEIPSTIQLADIGLEDGSETVEFCFGPGMYFPRLEVWRTKGVLTDADGVNRVVDLPFPELLSVAEIHAINVEAIETSNVAGIPQPVREEIRDGTQFGVTNNSGGVAVDAAVGAVGPGGVSAFNGKPIRARISLDGYPQNQYWAKNETDALDLDPVVAIADGETVQMYLQGYQGPANALDEIVVTVKGQALIETCPLCYFWLFGGTWVRPSTWGAWQGTDTEVVTSYDYSVVLQEQKASESGSAASEFSDGFSVQVVRPVVEISEPAHGSLVHCPSYGSEHLVRLVGSVTDLCGELTGDSPTLKINGSSVSIVESGSGVYTFETIQTVPFSGYFLIEATNSAGVSGTREAWMWSSAASSGDEVATADVLALAQSDKSAVLKARMPQRNRGVAASIDWLSTSVSVIPFAPAPVALPPLPPGRQFKFNHLNMADLIPSSGARRVGIRVSGSPEALEANITTSAGSDHAYTLSGSGLMVSPALYPGAAATGPGAISGWPVLAEVVEGNGGEGDAGKLPDLILNDQPSDLSIELVVNTKLDQNVNIGEEDRQGFAVRRIFFEGPNGEEEGDGIYKIYNGRILWEGMVTRADGSKEKGNIRLRIPQMEFRKIFTNYTADHRFLGQNKLYFYVDEDTWEELHEAAEATANKLTAFDATNLADSPEEAAAAASLFADLRQMKLPSSLGDWTDAAQGFFQGTGEAFLERINVFEMIRGVVALASTDWAQVNLGQVAQALIFGHISNVARAGKEGNFREMGRFFGHLFIEWATVAVPIGGAAALGKLGQLVRGKVLTAGPRAGAKAAQAAADLARLRALARARVANQPVNRVRINGRPSRLAVEGEVTVDKALIDSRLGAGASGNNWPDVDRQRFTNGELERGHLVARRFGGRGGNANIVPMHRVVNQTYAKRIEDVAADLALQGKTVKMKVTPIYDADIPTSSIPIVIRYEVLVDGVSHNFDIPNIPNLPAPIPYRGFPQGF